VPSVRQTPPDWFDRPLRWANLTLVQDDPGRYDPGFWLDLLRRAHCDAASWNAGGIVAFYPTRIPFHRRCPNLGEGDPFGELVEGCRKLGIFVTARVDHHATYPDAAEAHPEWLMRDASGRPRRHWAKDDLLLTCAFGPYNHDFMTGVLKEIQTRYGVDGFNQNRWGGQGMCYCERCRDGFRAFAGAELPLGPDGTDAGWMNYRLADPRDPLWQTYLAWRQERLLELWDLWDGEIRKLNPNAGLLPGMGGEMTRLDMRELRRRAHSLYLDRQGRHGHMPPWLSGKCAKELRAVMGGKPVGLTFSVGHEAPYRWKDSTQTEAEIRIWTADAVANGAHLKFCKFAGYLHDGRWPGIVERLYCRLARWEPYLRNTQSLARVAVVYSQQTARFYPRRWGGGAENHERYEPLLGMYQALLEARVPFEMVHDRLLEPGEIDRYALLILPNVACLSDAQCELLHGYVRRGGRLLATFETSLHDEWGGRRGDFGLADLFGVSVSGEAQGPMRNAYLRLEHGTRHPILKGFEDATRTIHGVHRLPVKATAAFGPPPVTLIPPYPDLPMEEVYPREDHTGIPEVYLRELGRGRVGYVPWDIDRTFFEIMDADHGRLLANLVAWTCGEVPPVEVEGPGLLDVTVFRQAGSLTVHLVNFTNPMTMRGPYRELIPVGPERVRLRLPTGFVPRRAQLLASGKDVPLDIEDGVLRVVVPEIADHEVLAVE